MRGIAAKATTFGRGSFRGVDGLCLLCGLQCRHLYRYAAKYFSFSIKCVQTDRNLQSHLVPGAKKAKSINLHYYKQH